MRICNAAFWAVPILISSCSGQNIDDLGRLDKFKISSYQEGDKVGIQLKEEGKLVPIFSVLIFEGRISRLLSLTDVRFSVFDADSDHIIDFLHFKTADSECVIELDEVDLRTLDKIHWFDSVNARVSFALLKRYYEANQ